MAPTRRPLEEVTAWGVPRRGRLASRRSGQRSRDIEAVAGYDVEPAAVRAALRRTAGQLPRYLARYRGVDAAAGASELDAALEDWAAASAGADGAPRLRAHPGRGARGAARHGRLWTPRAAHRARPRPHGLDRGRGSVARGRGRRQRADRRLAPRQPGRARRRSRPGLGPGPRGGARLPPRGSSSSGASSGGSSATCRPGSPAPAPSRRPSACPTARRCSRR